MDYDDSVKNGVMIKAGESLRLPAVVTGRPQPEVKWAKDEADIDPERMIVETVGKNSTLFIKKAVRADHGKYKISGTNSSGTKAAETRVDIMGQCLTPSLLLSYVSTGNWRINISQINNEIILLFLQMYQDQWLT